MKQQTMFPSKSKIELIQGDCLEVLREMPEQSVNCCVTSPPYWGLRDYGCEGQVWEDVDRPFPEDVGRHFAYCEHVWGAESKIKSSPQSDSHGGFQNSVSRGLQDNTKGKAFEASRGQFCQLCGAWKGSLGLEPTPELFISHLVQIFREVKRVLRDNGTLWVNMGDSYCANRGNTDKKPRYDNKSAKGGRNLAIVKHRKDVGDLKEKDLVGIPWMLAFALRADGWYLRMDIIWHKPNPMPESVKDRPTKAHEYIFLLSKSKKYFYDSDAILEECAYPNGPNSPQSIKSPYGQSFTRNAPHISGKRKELHVPTYSRHRASIQGGQSLTDRPGRNKRSVWTVTTKPFKDAHFATFSPYLIEPCIKAGCPEGGTVLDPFYGAGTTGLVCKNLGRDCVGIELNEDYCKIARERIGE